ncbi:MAG TPA: lysyl oxidase family protein [Polyangiaceae bacterium]|nr:lysyl oxidase family protein [Polyangiaceae bacterium]
MQSRSLVRRLVVAGSACSAVAISVALAAAAQEAMAQEEVLQSLAVDDDAAFAASGGHAAAGALVKVTLQSKVGVVLDEIPLSQRTAAANYYLSRPSQFWKDRAALQAKHTNYRLTYRHLFYEGSEPPKGMMAMPPEDLWRIDLKPGGARRVNDAGHDAIVIEYTLESHLLSDAASPAAADAALARIGGVAEEPFSFPLDPEFLFQRTGYACVDEDGYPLRTADSENVAQLFDQDCGVETPDEPSCHYTEFPDESCKKALQKYTGRVDTKLRFERIRYDRSTADRVRVASYTTSGYPDLAVLPQNLEHNRIVYRYIEPDSCAVEEACVTGSGWRRLLEYDASIKNTSTRDLTVGAVDESSPFVEHNVFEFSACHEHYHYSHYGNFSYGSLPGDKRAFCIESTDRYYNSEQTPLTHPYGCENQGIASGWGDTYIAGVECNWIDITDLSVPSAGTTQVLEFDLNPDDFICEGEPVLDANGEQAFTPTGEIGENGEPIDQPLCDFGPGYDANNLGQRNVSVPKDGGFITQACTRSQSGPLRDCGFKERAENLACSPGATVQLKCKTGASDPAQVMRVCENSAELGGVIACMYREAVASQVIGSSWTNVDFTCPAARGPGEPGGKYGYYTAGLLATDASRSITCQPR